MAKPMVKEEEAPPLEPQSPQPLPWMVQQATKPLLTATPEDYLNRPSTIEDLNRMYKGASPSFSPLQKGRMPEHLVPIDPEGRLGETSTGGDRHATAEIPTDSMAIIHSHPYGLTDTPSQDDINTATRINKPNFVVSGNSIYAAMPGGDLGHPVRVADIGWGKDGLKIKWNPNEPQVYPSGDPDMRPLGAASSMGKVKR